MGLLAWFSGPRVTAKDKAILDLKRQRDKVKQYQKRIAVIQARERKLAKECLAVGNRKRALLFLRKEQFQSQLLSKTDQQLASLEDLVTSIEFAQVQRDVAFGLKQGACVLKEINSEMSLENIEKIMDDSSEGIAYQREVEQLLNERITRSDDAAVELELEALESEIVGKPKKQTDIEKVSGAPNFPALPAHVPVEEQKSDANKEETSKTETYEEMLIVT